MTAGVLQGERKRSVTAGMDEFLAKPVTPTDLKAMLDKFVPPEKVPTVQKSTEFMGSYSSFSDEERAAEYAMIIVVFMNSPFLVSGNVKREGVERRPRSSQPPSSSPTVPRPSARSRLLLKRSALVRLRSTPMTKWPSRMTRTRLIAVRRGRFGSARLPGSPGWKGSNRPTFNNLSLR